MRCKQAPAALERDFAKRIEYQCTALPVEQTGQLGHLLAFQRDAFWTGFRQPGAGYVVAPVDRAGFVTVKVRPVASEGDEVPQ